MIMPHTFPTTEQNRWGGSPDPRRAPSPGLSKFQRDPHGRQGGWLRTRGVRPTKVCGITHSCVRHVLFFVLLFLFVGLSGWAQEQSQVPQPQAEEKKAAEEPVEPERWNL